MNRLILNASKDNQSLLGRRRAKLLANPTRAELHIKSLLDKLGERYIRNKGFYTSSRFFIVDFYIKRRGKLCLEIDGGYHENQVDYDRRRDEFLRRYRNVRVIRLTNQQAMLLDHIVLKSIIS